VGNKVEKIMCRVAKRMMNTGARADRIEGDEDLSRAQTESMITQELLENYADIMRQLREHLPKTIPEMNDEELLALGCRYWSEDEPILLIPPWLWPLIPGDTPIRTISGEEFRKSEEDWVDFDTRYGCMAYGLLSEEVDAGG